MHNSNSSCLTGYLFTQGHVKSENSPLPGNRNTPNLFKVNWVSLCGARLPWAEARVHRRRPLWNEAYVTCCSCGSPLLRWAWCGWNPNAEHDRLRGPNRLLDTDTLYIFINVECKKWYNCTISTLNMCYQTPHLPLYCTFSSNYMFLLLHIKLFNTGKRLHGPLSAQWGNGLQLSTTDMETNAGSPRGS